MTTQELEEILEGQRENPSVEFKTACNWDVSLFAKDMLAIANVRDGGHIIVGVEDGTFTRHGVTDAQLATYSEETIMDQVANYADPFITFSISFPEDRDGKKYVVIRIHQFDELPVICRKDGRDVKRGTIYYRTRNGRPQSSPITNSYDLRDILLLATSRTMQKLHDVGFDVSPSNRQQLESELEGL